MIGFYDYTVVVTYISLVSSILGMFCAIDGKLPLAVFCLAFSGLCDMFDGKIARTKKNRTDDEKSFGIQIDSLCDIVCFGHTHVAYLDQVDGITLLNPGSLSHSRDGKPCSYAILDINEDDVQVEFKFEPEW